MMNNTTNPYSTNLVSTPPRQSMDISQQKKVHEREEAKGKSNKVMPHPAATLQQSVSDLFIKLMEIKQIIRNTANEPNVATSSTAAALDIIDKISEEITITLPAALDKLYL